MARQISLHGVIDAVDKVLAELDELDEKGIGNPAEREKATSTMNEVKETLRALCVADDGAEAYYMVNS